jgi:hypothetical protein
MTERDRSWFDKHAGRNFYARRPDTLERAVDRGITVILVERRAPGMRFRFGLRVDEETAMAMMTAQGDEELRQLTGL